MLDRQRFTDAPPRVAATVAVGPLRHDIPQIVFMNGLAARGTERPLPWLAIVDQNEFHGCLHKKQKTSDFPSTEIVAPRLKISIERWSNRVATWFVRHIPRFALQDRAGIWISKAAQITASDTKHRKQSQ
jgi:hypothetical protein